MSQAFKQFLDIGDTRAIADKLASDGTAMKGDNGTAAQTACIILAVEQLEATIKKLDDAATRLQWASVVLAGVFGLIGVVGVVAAVIAIL